MKVMIQLFWLVLNMGVEVLVTGLLRVQCYWYARHFDKFQIPPTVHIEDFSMLIMI